MKRIVKEAVIEKKLTDEEKDIIRSHLECNYKIVMLYPINENTEIPTDALDPGVWNIPEGYYAIERDLEINPNLFIYSYIFRVILQYYQLSFY